MAEPVQYGGIDNVVAIYLVWQNPYNVGEFVVRITADKKLLTPSLEDKLNPLTINIVAAEVLPLFHYSHA